jgi:hypothetical protein
MMLLKNVTLFLAVSTSSAFALRPSLQQHHTSTTALSIGFIQGIFGKKDAEVTDTVRGKKQCTIR